MGRLGDLLAPSDVGYPGASGSSGNGDYQPPDRAGFLNRLFAPTDLPYPVPHNGFGAPRTGPAPSPPTATPAAPSAPPAATDGPVTVVVNVPGADATKTPAPAPSSSLAAKMPLDGCPVAPVQKIVTAYSTNPRLRARHPRAQEILVEEMIDEKITLRMLSKDSAPVAFVVPDGCTAVELTVGPIEINPGVGQKLDLDEVVTVGELVITGITAPLTAGAQISVVVPWRYGSWVEMAADHLRLPIYARFFQIQNA